MQNVAINFSETPGRVTHTGPPKAAFNDEVFGDLLGLGEEEVQWLKDTGVI
jgi:crotonobetainyl-CoA:carnitine CoA-transferase CaiB-like acyl-CoA transferase